MLISENTWKWTSITISTDKPYQSGEPCKQHPVLCVATRTVADHMCLTLWPTRDQGGPGDKTRKAQAACTVRLLS